MEVNMLNQNISVLKGSLKNRSCYVHPMRYEEALATAINYRERI